MRTMFFRKKSSIVLSVALALPMALSPLSAGAGTYTNDFNVDPATDPNPAGPVSLRGTAVWRSAGSFDGSGYISITDDVGSVNNAMVLPDFDAGAGAPVIGFRFYAKVRIGGGTARPADGMSISFADATDAVVGAGVLAAGEEGTATGLSVNFDTWDNGDGDGPAIDIKHNNVVVAHKRFSGTGSAGPYCAPVERDSSGNPISLETDPAGTADPGTWVDVEIILSPGGTATVRYKGIEIFRDVVTGYTPRVGRFVIGARTGGAWDNHWIDNIGITTDTGDPPPRVITATPTSVQRGREVAELTPIVFTIDAAGSFSQVDPASINLTLNGTDVTTSPNTTIDTVTTPGQTVITYTPTGLGYAPGTRQDAVLTYREDRDLLRNVTARKTFWVTPVPAATDLGQSLFIEAEDFNYSDGTTHGQFHDFGSGNGLYNGLAAQHTIDYNLAASNPDSALYRVLNPPNGIVGVGDNNRAGTPITPDYKVGWNDAGDWFNFTRTFPNNTYKVYGRFASGGADTHAQLDRVTSDRTVAGQTTQPLGTFDGDTTGGWDTFCFIPLRDAEGNDKVLRLSGLTTLRLTVLPGNYDANYLAFVPTFTETIRPSVVTLTPARDSESLRDPLIKAVLNDADADTKLNLSSIKLFLGGNEVTPITVTDTPGGAEVQYQVTNLLPFGSTQTATLIFQDDDPLGATWTTNTWSFTVGPFKGGGKTLFVEAEDFNYSDDGVTGGLHANFGDPSCSLQGKGGVRGVDYFQTSGNDGGAVPAYRPTTDVEAAKPGTDGLQRADQTITCSYIVGWNDPNEWQNYTRDFGAQSKRYNVYARLASGGAEEAVEFARITSDPTLPDQTKVVVGEFRSPPTGNWDVFHTVPLRNSAGELLSLRLSGVNTFRMTTLPGNHDMNYFAFVEADIPFVPVRIGSVEPRVDSNYARKPRIMVSFVNEDSAIVPNLTRLFYDGAEVTSSATITPTANGAEISYQVPNDSPVGTVHSVQVRWTDDQATPLTQSFSWNYTEGIYNAEQNLFIEIEDFNTAGGDFLPSKPGVPFNTKGLYAGLDAQVGVDYNDTTGDSHQYRAATIMVGMAALGDAYRTGAGPRPGFEVVSDYKTGWTDPGPPDWYNFTRDFGAGGTYNVYLRASHGDGAATIGGRLDHLDDPAVPTVISPLGNFRAPATGNWDGFTFIPLKDTTSQEVVVLPLSGVQTLRYSVEANGGDVNYLMFVPATPVGGRLTISRSGNNVTVTWPDGQLQSAPAITGPWTTEAGATSPFNVNNPTGMRFYRSIRP